MARMEMDYDSPNLKTLVQLFQVMLRFLRTLIPNIVSTMQCFPCK